MKTCNKCGEVKHETEFHKQKNSPDGFRYSCKKCSVASASRWNEENSEKRIARQKVWYQKTKDVRAAEAKAWKEKNRDRWNAYMRRYNAKNPEKVLGLKRVYRKANIERVLFLNRQREIKQQTAMPAWADANVIRAIYKEARRITSETGIKHDVDHIIPINGTDVTGLHVESNLRIIPATENRKKSNKLMENIL